MHPFVFHVWEVGSQNWKMLVWFLANPSLPNCPTFLAEMIFRGSQSVAFLMYIQWTLKLHTLLHICHWELHLPNDKELSFRRYSCVIVHFSGAASKKMSLIPKKFSQDNQGTLFQSSFPSGNVPCSVIWSLKLMFTYFLSQCLSPLPGFL